MRSSHHLRARAAAFGLLVVSTVSCSGSLADDLDEAGRRVAEPRLQAAVRGLCAARAEAQDVERAGRVFHDHVHQELHAIAAAVQERDRDAAARLLELKQRVEAALDARPAPRLLRRDLGRLFDAANAALVALNIEPAPPCPPRQP